jgi:dGTPase
MRFASPSDENRGLPHLRSEAGQTRGRRYAERPHPYRNVYQRDRDRVIHARAFRRLEHKTQVFTSPHSDHFRNRLTHTIEVSQIARTVASALALNEDLVEALALSHDIGHPPFGHSGEEVLNQQMRQFGAGFDHNLHALRIVEKLEQRYAAFPGLNLSFEVREGIIKHSRDYALASFPELEEYLLDQRPLLEAQLIDAADEITYNCADLDDAIDAGLIDADAARKGVPLFDQAMREAETSYPGATGRQIFNEALRHTLDRLVTGLIEGTRAAALAADLQSAAQVRDYPERLAVMSPEAADASKQLKELLAREVYHSPELNQDRRQTDQKVIDLFQFYIGSPEQLPASFQKQTQDQASQAKARQNEAGHEQSRQTQATRTQAAQNWAGVEALHRAVCDYIAGMTDKYLLHQHETLLSE